MTRIWAAGAAIATLVILTVFLRGPWEVLVHLVWVGLMIWSAALALHRGSAADAARSAALLAVVARAGKTMNRLGTEEVLEGVVAAVGEMGFESANISIIDEESRTYRVIHARGMPADYVSAVHPATIGMTGLAREARKVVAVSDYGSQAAAVPRLARPGFTSAVAGPIWVGGELEGVLIGGSKRYRKLRAEEVEAFELLATHAGVALENAQRYEELERSRAQIRQREDDVAARLGGDEFGVLLHDATPVEAAATARRLRATLGEPVALDGRTVVAGASVGLAAIALSAAADVDQLLGEADAAMYADKGATRR